MTGEAVLTPLRGGAELGPVALQLEVQGSRLLLDCGSAGAGSDEWVDACDEPDAVWISHAHLDHCGALPELVLGRPRLDMVATPATSRLVEWRLRNHPDCDEQRASDIRAGIRGPASGNQLRLPEQRDPEVETVDARILRAGHELGSSMFHVDPTPGEQSGGLLYTGDFCLHDQPLVRGAALEEVTGVETLVMEGVLATDEQADAASYAESMRGLVQWCRERTGPALIAVQRGGEAIEVASGLAESGLEVGLHESLEGFRAVYEDAFDVSGLAVDVEPELATRLFDGGVVLAPADQLEETTPSNRLAGRIAGNPEARIGVLNRAYDSTPAGELLAAASGERLTGFEGRPEKRADVRRFVLPTHAPRSELLEIVEKLHPHRVILVHGRESQLYALRRALREAGYTGEVAVPQNGEILPVGTTS